MIPDSGSGAGRGAGMGEFPRLPRLKPPGTAGPGRLRAPAPEQRGMGTLG